MVGMVHFPFLPTFTPGIWGGETLTKKDGRRIQLLKGCSFGTRDQVRNTIIEAFGSDAQRKLGGCVFLFG